VQDVVASSGDRNEREVRCREDGSGTPGTKRSADEQHPGVSKPSTGAHLADGGKARGLLKQAEACDPGHCTHEKQIIVGAGGASSRRLKPRV